MLCILFRHWQNLAGDAMGFVLQADGMSTLYFVGDTIWHPYVEVSLKMYSPDIIVMNTGYAVLNTFEGSLIMGKDDILRMYKVVPEAKIIAVHMDAVNHTMQSSEEVRAFVKSYNLQDRVYVPHEGETLTF